MDDHVDDYLTLDRLDRSFNELLNNLEPFVQKFSSRRHKSLIQGWIQKFKSQDFLTVPEKKVRNQYCAALFEMVRRGDLEEPFTEHPADLHSLPPLPAQYLATASLPEPRLPDWLERMNHENTLTLTRNSAEETRSTGRNVPHRTPHSTTSIHRVHPPNAASDEEESEDEESFVDTRREPDRWVPPHVSKMASDLAAESTLMHLHEKEMIMHFIDQLERKTQQMQSQFHEEIANLQDRHKRDAQRLIDRKNEEIEEMKTEYEAKLKEQEVLCAKFEKKVLAMSADVRQVKEAKEKEREELRRSFLSSAEAKEAEMARKMEALVREFERERDSLQTGNKRRYQAILEDTTTRLREMEGHYKDKISSCESTICELEVRVAEVAAEADRTKQARDQFERQNVEITKRIQEETNDNAILKTQFKELEHQYEQNLKDNAAELAAMREKHASQLSFAREERERSDSRIEEMRSDLENQLAEQRRRLRVTQESHEREITTRQADWASERQRLEQALGARSVEADQQHEVEIARLRGLIRSAEEATAEREAEVQRLREEMDREKAQTEEAMSDLRQQMEASSHRHLEDMRRQIEHVEADLSKSRGLREKAAREQARQLATERERASQEVSALREEWASEKEALMRQHEYEIEAQRAQYATDVTQVREALQTQLSETQARWTEQNESDSRQIAVLEQRIRQLKEEASREAQLRKQQLLELGLLREEERKRLQNEHAKSVEDVRVEFQRHRIAAEKQHADEMEHLLKKTNEKLKEIEGEYSARAQQAAQTISDLQNCVQQLTSERTNLKAEAERLLSEKQRENEEEKERLHTEHKKALEALQQTVASGNTKMNELQRRLNITQQEHEIVMARLRAEYDSKMRDLMPACVQRELEETIQSLKTQISFLNRRIKVIQEEEMDERDCHLHASGDYASGHHLAGPVVISAN